MRLTPWRFFFFKESYHELVSIYATHEPQDLLYVITILTRTLCGTCFTDTFETLIISIGNVLWWMNWADLQFIHQFTYSPYFWGILRYWLAWRKKKNWLTMTFPCEELAISLEMAKWVGIGSRRPRRHTAASDYRWTNGAGKRYMFSNRRGLCIYFWSGGYEIRENFTRLEGVFGKFG